jgi:Motility quorum-sensing regulator, toxin of MqsA
MRHVILALSRRDFYKAMTTHTDHQVRQDVYHGMTLDAVPTCWRTLEGLAQPKTVYQVQPVVQLAARASGRPVSAIRPADKRKKRGSRSF